MSTSNSKADEALEIVGTHTARIYHAKRALQLSQELRDRAIECALPKYMFRKWGAVPPLNTQDLRLMNAANCAGRRNTVHFSVGTGREGDPSRVFWVHYSDTMPSPMDFFLLDPAEVPEIVEWHTKASQLDARIEKVMQIRKKLANHAPTRSLVKKHSWYSKEVIEHVHVLCGGNFANDMEIITDYMAQAALTGEGTLRSWVDWKSTT